MPTGPRRFRKGNVVRFRKRSRWTKASAYGVKPARFGRPRKSWRQAWFETRPIVFLIALVTIAVIYQTPGFYEPPAFLQSAPDRVEGVFTRCGPGRGAFCVINGDTFKLGDTKYRVTGIDTAEIAVLTAAYEKAKTQYAADKAAATKLLAVGESPRNEKIDVTELAAWTMVANVLINLDEMMTKN